jgi:hypothetical protein
MLGFAATAEVALSALPDVIVGGGYGLVSDGPAGVNPLVGPNTGLVS